MIDPKTLLPMVKQVLPNESDQDIMAGIQEFIKVHPDFNNQQAMQALVEALKQMQGAKQPAAPAPNRPFGEGLMGALGSK